MARLLPLAGPKRFWIITNEDLRPAITKQLPKVPKAQVLAEPVGRNTAPAIGLAAFLLQREDPEAVIGMFPSDHVIANETRYRDTLQRGIEIAAAGANIVVLGIKPNRPETGYGYIEAGASFDGDALRVRRFTEKPDAEKAAEFVAAGNYYWNSGMFSVECAHARRCVKGAPPKDRSAARGNRSRLRHAQVCGDLSQAISEVRKHQRGLCCARAPFGEGRAGG